MKACGIVRKIDNLGRIVIPVEISRTLGIIYKDPQKYDGTGMDIYQDGNSIVMEVATEKTTGVIRNVDNLGRIVLPIELSRKLSISREDRTAMEFYMDGSRIVLRKYEPGCVLCGSMNNTQIINGKHICSGCIRTIKAAKF